MATFTIPLHQARLTHSFSYMTPPFHLLIRVMDKYMLIFLLLQHSFPTHASLCFFMCLIQIKDLQPSNHFKVIFLVNIPFLIIAMVTRCCMAIFRASRQVSTVCSTTPIQEKSEIRLLELLLLYLVFFSVRLFKMYTWFMCLVYKMFC